ncbi:MAG TPA: hypothetical protein VGR14_19975 [Verrucomicrobiae bacterium]|nr:hypothetical protein [Verrucomicrobiae bacterium]
MQVDGSKASQLNDTRHTNTPPDSSPSRRSAVPPPGVTLAVVVQLVVELVT